jgi:hypothetical protein
MNGWRASLCCPASAGSASGRCWPRRPAAASHDVVVYFTYGRVYAVSKMLDNVTQSAFWTWLLFAAMLLPASLVQLRRGFDGPYFDRWRVPKHGRPQLPPEKRFRLYAITGGAGLLVFGALALIF